MRALTESEIEKLANRPGVYRITVENFLGTILAYGKMAAEANLYLDGKKCQWNQKTKDAIMAGIRMASEEGK